LYSVEKLQCLRKFVEIIVVGSNESWNNGQSLLRACGLLDFFKSQLQRVSEAVDPVVGQHMVTTSDKQIHWRCASKPLAEKNSQVAPEAVDTYNDVIATQHEAVITVVDAQVRM
jgi:hypothetical protein